MSLSPHVAVSKMVKDRETLAKAKVRAGLPLDEASRPLTQSERIKLQLEQYLPVCKRAARADPEFYAHLCSWNALKGEVKDARVALPVIALTAPNLTPEFHENAVAHIASLDPRLFLRALSFAQDQKIPLNAVKKLAARYLRDREANVKVLERAMLQHRAPLRRLYSLYWVEPVPYAKAVLFGPGKKDNPDDPRWQVPAGCVFDIVSRLDKMTPLQAASAIIRFNIPLLVAEGALKEKLRSTDVVLALIKSMSPTELINRTKMLQKLGVRKDAVLRAAFDEALEKAGRAGHRSASLKANRAAEVLSDEEDPANAVLITKLNALQERVIEEKLSFDGDWLVLGDRSGSMQHAIELARQVSAMIARGARGKIYLVFFNESPQFFDVTGKTYEELKDLTKNVIANGGTWIGCGLDYILERGLSVDGIAIVSDGGENRAPVFAEVYLRYEKKFNTRPIVYFWRTTGDTNVLSRNCERAGISLEEFDVPTNVDYYSLPNLISKMRVKRYSLLDEIRQTPLLTLDEVLQRTRRGTYATA